jgi:hypothetical protein
VLPLLPVLLVELCAIAWLATKTMPAVARPKPHPIRFIIPPCLVSDQEPGAWPALAAVWHLKR